MVIGTTIYDLPDIRPRLEVCPYMVCRPRVCGPDSGKVVTIPFGKLSPAGRMFPFGKVPDGQV